MKTKGKKSLLANIIKVIGVSILLIGTIQIVCIFSSSRKIISGQVESDYVALSQSYSEQISLVIDSYYAALDMYINADIVEAGSTDQIVSWLKSVAAKRNACFDYVAYVDADGNFQADNNSVTNVTSRDYYQNILRHGYDSFIDNPVSSLVTGKTIVHVCRAVKRDGRNIGFFTGIVSINTIKEMVADIRIGESGVASLFSGAGNLIASSGNEAQVAESAKGGENAWGKEVVAKSAASDGGGFFWDGGSGRERRFNIYNAVRGTQWVFVMSIASTQVFKVANVMLTSLLGSSLVLVVVLIAVIAVLVSRVGKSLVAVETTIAEIASGDADLTRKIEIKTREDNEISRLVKGYNTFVDKLHTIVLTMKKSKSDLVQTGEELNRCTEDTAASITEIIANIGSMTNNINAQAESVSTTAAAVNEIASNIESLNRMIENQSSSVVEASAAVEEMIGNINSVDNSMSRMASEFSELAKKSSVGVEKQNKVNESIKNIETESKALQEANAVISNIAGQTNLLAMNAAIEAAHAGEAGKGFSVVADEIRKLSETSGAQSKAIGLQLKKIKEIINEIVAESGEAGGAMADVSASVSQIHNLVEEIKNAMQEQAEGSKQIFTALNAMNDSTAEVRTSSSEMSAGNKTILSAVQVLQDATFGMKQGMEEMNIGATKINETGSNLSALSARMSQSIEQIGSEVDQFTV